MSIQEIIQKAEQLESLMKEIAEWSNTKNYVSIEESAEALKPLFQQTYDLCQDIKQLKSTQPHKPNLNRVQALEFT